MVRFTAVLVLLALTACAHRKPTPAQGDASAEQPLRVPGVRDEYDFIRAQRCRDGSAYRVLSQSLLKGERGCLVDQLKVSCEGKMSPDDRDSFSFAICEE